jgi:hypothetical protein
LTRNYYLWAFRHINATFCRIATRSTDCSLLGVLYHSCSSHSTLVVLVQLWCRRCWSSLPPARVTGRPFIGLDLLSSVHLIASFLQHLEIVWILFCVECHAKDILQKMILQHWISDHTQGNHRSSYMGENRFFFRS